MEQATREYCMELVKELIDGADAGDFAQPIIPDKYKWGHLLGLFLIKDELDGGADFYRDMYELAIRSGENYLRQKAERGERVRVVFQTYSAAQWPAEKVYRRFDAMPNVDVKIVVSPLVDRDVESTLESYRQSSQWYKENGYHVVDGLDIEAQECGDWGSLGGYPDVLYQLSSWFNCLPRNQWFTQLPLRSLVAYIPYGIAQADSANGRYAIESIFNKDIVNLMWRVYADSRFGLSGYQKHQFLKGKNVRYSGYAKMDYFYEEHAYDEDYIRKLWGVSSGMDVTNMKKVIVAPHYTVFPESEICYSTFHKNMWFWLYLVKKYEKQICFLFKPHPNLRRSAVAMHLFKSYDEYDEYIQTWNNCPNAIAVQEGNYLEYFETSDAMIMDSGSFLGEYLYTGKPMLYLTRPEQTFNEAGWKLVNSYYKTPGENYAAIEQFIDDVVLAGNDSMVDVRKKVLDEAYDYYKINGQLASDFIANEVVELIGNRK